MNEKQNKHSRINFITITFSLIIGLALCEGFLQLAYRCNWTSLALPYGLRGDNVAETLYSGLTPNYSGTSRLGITYTTNSLGFRDDQPITQGTDHLVFLGDSTTFGLNINHRDTFPEKIEHALVSRRYHVQSMNTAAPGQGTISEQWVLDRCLRDPSLNIRCVILGFYRNDLSNNIWFQDYLRSKGKKKPETALQYRFQYRTWLYIDAFFSLIRGSYTHPRAPENEIPYVSAKKLGFLNQRNEYSVRPGREVEWNWLNENEILQNRSYIITVESLRTIIAMCQEKDIPLVFIFLPDQDELISQEQPRYKKLLKKELSRTKDVTIIDMAQVYQEYLHQHGLATLPKGFYSVPHDATHPGPLACTLIAETLLPEIEKLVQSPR